MVGTAHLRLLLFLLLLLLLNNHHLQRGGGDTTMTEGLAQVNQSLGSRAFGAAAAWRR